MKNSCIFILLFTISLLFSCKQKKEIITETKQPVQKIEANDEIDYSQGIILNNIKFAAMSDKIFSSSYPSLDMLVKKMRRLPYLKIRIVSYYSDYVNEAYNEKLAMQRAEAIKKYLVANKIDEQRIYTEGFGDQMSSEDYVQEDGKTTMIKVYYRKSQGIPGYSNLIILKEIKFGKLSDKLFSSSHSTLDRLANFLVKNRKIKILISGYTDNEGDDDFNLRLSKKRAEEVKKHLVAKKVSSERITIQGLGESNPILPNNTEAGRKKNNRIEVSFKRGQ